MSFFTVATWGWAPPSHMGVAEIFQDRGAFFEFVRVPKLPKGPAKMTDEVLTVARF
ncbi:hypothetical protein GCM10022225_82500 [Plantactinospora mayteni]|uniref:Uncharacterized protein n=1 Tax=Plantactinospora mayteni TaxID=566021 RepID=A0ABQ4F463_9ACTN|nr:hypothetical protein Pma05_82390 [Plantactinospora mayteni]